MKHPILLIIPINLCKLQYILYSVLFLKLKDILQNKYNILDYNEKLLNCIYYNQLCKRIRYNFMKVFWIKIQIQVKKDNLLK